MKQMIDKYNGSVSLIDKMKGIYKWHNGLVLEGKLKEISGDETFKFLPNSEPEEYLFINRNDDFIVIDNYGNLQSKGIHVDSRFIDLCKSRLTRTSEMFNQFGYN